MTTTPTPSLNDRTVLVIGGNSGIARQLAADATSLGARVVRAGRRPATDTVTLDLGDENSIARAAEQVGPVDHVVSLAAAHANGPLSDLEPDAIRAAFDAKVIGPLLVAKHMTIREGGSLLFFGGVAAYRPAPGLAVMATTNGAVDHLVQALAVELAPVRVNALSPGIVDSGAWDGMGADKESFLERTAAANPARRVGTTRDISAAALALLVNPFVTGTTLHVDGGGRLA